MAITSKTIRYGIVGLGRSGWDIHVKDLRQRDDAEVAAVVDPVLERREEATREFGCPVYERLSAMLKETDLEVTVIATPSMRHATDTIEALRAGKHVVVEKPMAMNVREADRMIAASQHADQQLFIHHNYRFKRAVTHLLEVAQSGLIGRLYHVRSYQGNFVRRNDWQTLSKNGCGVLNNTCPHEIDILLQLMGGPVVDVMGDLQQIASAGDVEDHVKAFLRASNGCTADMEITTSQDVATQIPRWILCGSYGTLTSDGGESVIRWFDPKEASPIDVVEGAAANRVYENDDRLPWQEKTVKTQGPDIGNFYDNVTAVLTRGEPMVVTPEAAREVVRVTAEIRKGTKFG